MGLYDNVVGTCPSCKASFSIQTKILGDNVLGELKEDYGGIRWTGKLLLKEGCICGLPVIAVCTARFINICSGDFIRLIDLSFSNDSSIATHQEHVGGELRKIRQH